MSVRLLIALWLAAAALLPLRASARELPRDAPQKLAAILGRPEYQPRRERLSYLTRLKRGAFARAVRYVRELQQQLEEFFRESPAARGAMRKFFGALAVVLRIVAQLAYYLFLPIVLLVVGWRLWRTFGAGRAEPASAVAGLAPARSAAPAELEDLLRRGEWLMLLAELRRRLRSEVCARYPTTAAMTDREAAAALPTGGHPLFQETAALFERAVFAREALDPPLLERLVQRYRHPAGGEAK